MTSMKIFEFLIALPLLAGCTESTSTADHAFAERVLNSELRQGMHFSEVKSVFLKHGRDITLFMECEKKNQIEGVCSKQSIGTIPLPSDNWWLGKGDAQVYMSFTPEENLESYVFEIYYENEH